MDAIGAARQCARQALRARGGFQHAARQRLCGRTLAVPMKIDAAGDAVCARPGAAAAMAFALLLAIGSGGAASVTVIDSVGARVELAQPARRIVSLAPHATELLFAAGAGSQVIGVMPPADWPAEAAALPRVGDSRAIDLERIADLRPDLVVAWPYVAPAQIGHLRDLCLAVYLSDTHTPEEIADDL